VADVGCQNVEKGSELGGIACARPTCSLVATGLMTQEAGCQIEQQNIVKGTEQHNAYPSLLIRTLDGRDMPEKTAFTDGRPNSSQDAAVRLCKGRTR